MSAMIVLECGGRLWSYVLQWEFFCPSGDFGRGSLGGICERRGHYLKTRQRIVEAVLHVCGTDLSQVWKPDQVIFDFRMEKRTINAMIGDIALRGAQIRVVLRQHGADANLLQSDRRS